MLYSSLYNLFALIGHKAPFSLSIISIIKLLMYNDVVIYMVITYNYLYHNTPIV